MQENLIHLLPRMQIVYLLPNPLVHSSRKFTAPIKLTPFYAFLRLSTPFYAFLRLWFHVMALWGQPIKFNECKNLIFNRCILSVINEKSRVAAILLESCRIAFYHIGFELSEINVGKKANQNLFAVCLFLAD